MFLDYFSDTEPDLKLEPGATIFSEGEMGDTAYVVESGEVDIFVHSEKMSTAKESQMFGEMALLDNEKRSATAKAGKNGANLYSIDQPVLIEMVRLDPKFALDIMKLMAERLRATDKNFGK